ncbi:MAG: hypothetical protein FVQ81_14715 [Candidatus Glassbacteria bacterium]|nr:hypothetical protein [Candidatus Glassbacteria bacterium]
MAGTDAEYDRLREQVQRDRRELEEVSRELERIGAELRRDHIRRAQEDRASGAEAAEPVNQMCRACFNSCKQPASVKIHHCDRYKPLDR